jgi:hypothetical protein
VLLLLNAAVAFWMLPKSTTAPAATRAAEVKFSNFLIFPLKIKKYGVCVWYNLYFNVQAGSNRSMDKGSTGVVQLLMNESACRKAINLPILSENGHAL